LKGAQTELKRLEAKFAKLSGRVLNIRSLPQLGELFYGFLGKKPTKLTKKGQKPSLDDEVFETWADEGDELAIILREFRTIDKLANTYLKGMMKRADAAGYIHPTLNQNGASTGRLSSSKPNAQNIPRPENDRFNMRSCFIAPRGRTILDYDFSQLEMVLIADFAQERYMLEAIASNKDLHAITAALMYDADYDAIVAAKKKRDNLTEEELELKALRNDSKTTGFTINYGGGPGKVSKALKCSFEEAKLKIARYFAARPGLKDFIDHCAEFSEGCGYIQTISGRWRMLSGAMSSDFKIRKNTSRVAANSAIQGSAADVVRLAMLNCARSKVLKDLDIHMFLQIHDEILFDCPNDKATIEIADKEIKKLLELPYADILDVKLIADGGYGDNWREAKGE
jgi:DNA polymerase-1